MSYDDEPDEPTQEEIDAADAEQAVRDTPTVRIEGLTATAVAAIVRETIESNYGLRNHAREAVDEAVRAVVAEASKDVMRKVAEEHLRPVIVDLLTNGWPVTNQWGEPQGGSRKGLSEILRELLFNKDNYHNRKGYAFHLVDEELAKALKGPLGEEIAKAQKMVREALDSEVMARFRKAMKDGLGLKD